MDGISPASRQESSSSPGRSTQRFFKVRAEYLPAGATLLRVQGMLDHSTGPLLERRLIAEARTCRIQPARLLLDLSGTTFLDRAGLDALLQSQAMLAGTSCTLELTELTPPVVRLLHEAHLDGESWMPPASRQ